MSLDKFFTRFWLIVTIICFILIGISLFVDAGDQRIGLEWDANTEENLTGYNVYVSHDAGGPYELIDTVGKDTTEFWWYGILSGSDYYFVVTAFNDEALESGYSNEVCAYINNDKDFAIECGTEYPENPPPEDPENDEDDGDGGGGSSGGCFINSL